VFGWSTLVIGLTLSAYGMLMALAQAVVMPRAGGAVGGNAAGDLGDRACGRVVFVGFGVANAAWMVLVMCPWRR
jgi:DHA1 family tetracycline resistance protein-like MFS transporter